MPCDLDLGNQKLEMATKQGAEVVDEMLEWRFSSGPSGPPQLPATTTQPPPSSALLCQFEKVINIHESEVFEGMYG